MDNQDKTKEELINELQNLKHEISSLKALYAEDTAGCLRLRESLQMEMDNLETIFESSPVSMLVLDERTTIVRANKAAIILTGGSEAEVLQHRPGNALGCVRSMDDPRGCGYSKTCLLCPARNGIEALLAGGGSLHEAEIPLILIRNGEPQRIWLEMSAENIQLNGHRHLCVSMNDITERKKVEAQLILNEEKFRSTFDQSPVGSVIVGLDNHFIRCNTTFCDFIGYTEIELIGKTISDITYPEDTEIGMKELIQMARGEILTATAQKRYLRKDGIIVWGQITISLVRDENNLPLFFLPIIQDITQIKHAVDELFKKEALLRITGETAKVGGWEFDVETLKQTWTDEVYRIHELDFTFNPNVSNGINFYAPISQPAVEAAVQQAIEFGEPFDLELEFFTSKGNHRWVRSIGKAYQENDKTKKVYGSIQDITERKRAEDSLHESQHLMEKIINTMPVRVFWKDKNSVYLGCNAIFALDAGFSDPKDIIGKDDFQMGWRDQAEFYRSSDRQVMESGCPILLNEEPQTTPDGKTIIMLTNKLPLKNSIGEIYGIIGTSMDVTDRIAAVQEIKLRNEELQKLNATKDKFFSIIAHDMKSPFNGFLGLTQVMAENMPSLTMAQVQDIAVSMRKSATNLYRLLENLLQWSQVQQGTISFNPEAVKLGLVVDESLEMIQELSKKKGIEIVLDIPEDLEVFADTNMLQTIIRNLVSNAVKFTPAGGKVNVSARGTNDQSVEIRIHDTGIGMYQSMIENLFRIDVKTGRKGTEGEPSTGLGLLLCKEFIVKHDGEIWVESEVGKGSTFYFTLPDHTNPEEKKHLHKDIVVDGLKNPVYNLKILIADDDADSEKLLILGVRKFGSEVLKSKTGVEVVETCRTNPDIDLIMMDIQMPVMNGYDATRQIREFNKEVIIIAQTAFGLSGDREKAIEAGCNDYISKPIKKEELHLLIQKYFSK